MIDYSIVLLSLLGIFGAGGLGWWMTYISYRDDPLFAFSLGAFTICIQILMGSVLLLGLGVIT